MNYKLLGKSGLRVSELCLGTMTFGEEWGWGANKTDSKAMFDAFSAAGVNFIDTADSYGPHVSEELIAEALWPYPANLVITTKAGWVRHGPGVWQHNAAPAHIEEALEGSL